MLPRNSTGALGKTRPDSTIRPIVQAKPLVGCGKALVRPHYGALQRGEAANSNLVSFSYDVGREPGVCHPQSTWRLTKEAEIVRKA